MAFVLSELEQKAIQSLSSLHQVHEYGLRNMNVIRVKPDSSITGDESIINFTLDSSNLAGNIPINRIEMEIEFEVTAVGNITTNTALTYDGTTKLLTANMKTANSYLMSVTNGAMDSLCGNKAFSSVDLTSGQVSLVKDTRNFQKVEILSRMLSQENLREAGVYPEDNYGEISEKAPGYFELISLTNPTALQSQYPRGSDLWNVTHENLYYKRNTSQYITPKPSIFKTSGDVVIPTAATPYPWASVGSGNSSDRVTGYEWATPGDYVNCKQVQKFVVREDLLHDITASKYQVHPTYMGLPSSQLTFAFAVSPYLRQLYKSSNVSVISSNGLASIVNGLISSVDVKIKNMTLNVLTYNHGMLAIVPRPYYVPFYSENVDTQSVTLYTNAVVTNSILNTIRYNSMPEYVITYIQEPTQNNSTYPNGQMPLTTNKITRAMLSIDNDVNGALYNMTVDEIKQRTLTNLDDDSANIQALFRRGQNICSHLRNDANTYTATPSFLNMNYLDGPVSSAENRAYLEGLVILKIGKDIRIPANMMAGINEKVSFTWQFDFSAVSNPEVSSVNNAVQCQVVTTAFFPSYYKFSPHVGLEKSDKIVVSPAEFDEMINQTNSHIHNMHPTNDVFYTHDSPLLIGSGLYGGLNLLEIAHKALPYARKAMRGLRVVANLAHHLTKGVDHDVARAIHQGSKVVKDLLGVGRNKQSKQSKRKLVR